LKRETPASIYVFVSERLAPLSVAGYQRMVARAGDAAGFPFLVHSHMLRHSCGYKLANDGQESWCLLLPEVRIKAEIDG
ncbi:MAG: tyrosine-type recombinase/integrase, partial [Pseudolabrys sp.]